MPKEEKAETKADESKGRQEFQKLVVGDLGRHEVTVHARVPRNRGPEIFPFKSPRSDPQQGALSPNLDRRLPDLKPSIFGGAGIGRAENDEGQKKGSRDPP